MYMKNNSQLGSCFSKSDRIVFLNIIAYHVVKLKDSVGNQGGGHTLIFHTI